MVGRRELRSLVPPYDRRTPMLHTLTIPEILAVRRALGAGLRHTEIARELNLSVWTIDRIAVERRHEDESVREDELPPGAKLPEDDCPPDYVAQNLRRCPGCGAMVYVWPCITCQMATMTQPVPPAPEVDDEPEEEQAEALSIKQRRWRRKQVRRLVFGEEV